MVYVGRIEALPRSAGIDQSRWIALIGAYDSLAPVPPLKGINPFTREPCEYKAPVSTAIVRVNAVDVGSISWAVDDSPMLDVYAEDDSVTLVANLADEIAKVLGARFVLEADE